MGFADGMRGLPTATAGLYNDAPTFTSRDTMEGVRSKPKRKLSPWNKFVKANSKKPRFIYKSGSNKGKLNLKKMGVAFRKTPAGKKKK
jgi:hypothetical protein